MKKLSIKAAMARAAKVDAQESARCSSPDVTLEVIEPDCRWRFWGRNRLVTVWRCADGKFQVILFRPSPMTVIKETLTKDPPRTAAQALKF